MITFKTCPLCDSVYIKDYSKAVGPMTTAKLSVFDLPAAYVTTYSLCHSCGLIFQNPRMEDRDINLYYSSGAYRASIDMSTEEMDKDELYRAKMDGKILKELGRDFYAHLDIGCSRGYLLREVGADVRCGVDSNPHWLDPDCRMIEVQTSVAKLPNIEFDLITMVHVLEHVSNPRLMLQETVARLTKDGVLFIEVPSDGSPGGWARLPHLYHFQPWTLRSLIESVGLSVGQVMYTPHLVTMSVFS